MNRTMITATNTLAQLQLQMDSISHNLANVQTNGYKRKESTFSDLLYQQFNNQPDERQEIGRLTPPQLRQGVGAKIGQSQHVLSQGAIKTTDRSLDVAFTERNQFLKVLVEENGDTAVRFTRDGALYVSPINDDQVILVNSEGHPVVDENDKIITIDGNIQEFTITPNGEFRVTREGQADYVANLGVISVQKPQFLESKGGNLLGLPADLANLGIAENQIYTNLAGEDRGQVALQQGVLEQSNVDMGAEMTELINVQRAYQFQSRAISMADQMQGLVNGLR
ncbi:flagellar hook-basal body protein [Mangrovibacillus cuniculi]|uniref:Flagellar hook-basal body protein n=1 Tax=Mangrovibacillus cuniculi TaxID=2593652 RepID=A0A7S8HGQ9_9BACI|nr:flagellar hook-basal body protein [Mangrovibacillus cuniculi]QPC47690.1 flagellar hook-basal body protein [Mangrovibacillus cuniculi]